MKVVIGIIVISLVLAALVLYIMLMINSHDLVFCGDIPQQGDNASLSVTRIYTSDINANETLSEIINTMNSAEDGNMTSEQMTEILANYQNIIYAPVFIFTLSQEDSQTYVLTGNIYNGLYEGEPVDTDFIYNDLTLTAGVASGRILAAQNIYPDDIDESGDPEFKERKAVVDPILISDGSQAAFAFKDCSSFRLVFTNTDSTAPASVTLAFTYDITARNPLNFTRMDDGFMGVTIYADYNDRNILTPTLTLEHRNIITELNSSIQAY